MRLTTGATRAKYFVLAKRYHDIVSDHLMTLKSLQNSISVPDKKDSGYFQKLFVDILQNVVVDISAVKFSVSSVLPNKKRFAFGFGFGAVTIHNKDLSKDNTIRDMIIKKVYIFCTKTFPLSSSGNSERNSKIEKVPRKSKILDDINITLTVVNRDEMLSLTIKIQENIDFSLYSKQYLNLTYVMASLSTRLENLKIMASVCAKC